MAAETRNKGYGNSGEGGDATDAAVIDKVNQNDNRTVATQGSPPTPPEPLPTVDATLDTGDQFSTKRNLFQTEVNDLIVCHSLTGDTDEEGGVDINIAKPHHLRKTTVDTNGVFVDGIKIEYTGAGRRTVTFEALQGGEFVFEEKIDPAYTIVDQIIASQMESTGVAGITLQDMNIQNRQWASLLPKERYFQIVEINKDTMWGQEWDYETDAQKVDAEGTLLERELIAKPSLIRGSFWDGKTTNDAAYTVEGDGSEAGPFNVRSGSYDGPAVPETPSSEEQEITPPWVENETIIKAMRMDDGTGAFRDSVQPVWEDSNDGARAFAEIFETGS